MRQHHIRARVNALVERLARRHQTNFQGTPARQRRTSGSVDFGDRPPRQDANLNGANQFLLIRSRDFSCGFRVQAFEQPVQLTRAMLLGAGAQPFSQFFGALWNIRQALKQRAQIQTCANGKNWQPAATPQVLENS